jgi:hypothetical protein
LGHPTQVFSNKGEQEQDLITRPATCSYASNNSCHTPVPQNYNSPATDQETLSEAYSTFFTAFSAWKARDSTVLVQTMIAQFVELDAIWQTVKSDTNGDVAADYREGIRDNQTMLLVRLKSSRGLRKQKQ